MNMSGIISSVEKEDTLLVGNSCLEEYVKQLRQKYFVNNRVLLVQTLQCQLDAFNPEVVRNRGYYAYPPTGMQWLVKALGQRAEVEILDLNYQLLKRVIEDKEFNYLDWLDILDERIEQFQPSIIGVTCIGISTDLFKPNHPLTEVLRHLKENDKHIVMAGGPIATDEFESYLNYDLSHFIVKGEGENKINFLFDYLLDEERSHAPTVGINFKLNNRIEETNGKKDQVSVFGNLIDTYKHVPIETYNQVGSLNPFSRMAGQDVRFGGIQLNRGCRANCRFCGVPKFMGSGVRQSPAQEVYAEMLYLIEEKGVRHFELLDDDFLGPASLRDGVTELLEKMCFLKQKYGITWSAGNGLIAGSTTDHLMQLINDSGCIGFRIGLESGNPEMLKKMRKPASVYSAKLFASKICRYPNMFVASNYILGLYGEETFGQTLDTFRLSCELGLDWSSYAIYQFTSKTTSRVENLKDDKKGATECIPSKDSKDREIKMAEGVALGIDIFHIPKDTIPSRKQIAEIWFVFNLFSNYINNKNLKPGGRPDKLASWLQALQVTYPHNPYMPLFASYCYVLMNNQRQAQVELKKVGFNLQDSEYWNKRFEQFHLFDLINKFPQSEDDACARLGTMREQLIKKEYLLDEESTK